MALTELQLPDKNSFYQNLRALANEQKRAYLRLKEASEFLATVTSTDLDSIGVPAGAVRTDLVALRTSIDNVVSAIGAELTTIDKFRNMLVV